jgi:hypothetical protein
MAPDLAVMLTRHARSRMQQRGIAPDLLDSLLCYGTEQHDRHGGVIVYIDRRARRRLARDRHARRTDLDRLQGLYAVLAGGCVATVGHRYRRLRT